MKVYEKPRVYIEKFELSEHVADCGWELQNDKVEVCFATGDPEWGYIQGVKGFLTESSICDTNPYAYCYTNGSSEIGLFKS